MQNCIFVGPLKMRQETDDEIKSCKFDSIGPAESRDCRRDVMNRSYFLSWENAVVANLKK